MWKKWSEDTLRDYNAQQVEEIQKYKWIESEKIGHDIGEFKAAVEWVRLYSAGFREQFIAEKHKK